MDRLKRSDASVGVVQSEARFRSDVRDEAELCGTMFAVPQSE